eukprot:g16385.t1
MFDRFCGHINKKDRPGRLHPLHVQYSLYLLYPLLYLFLFVSVLYRRESHAVLSMVDAEQNLPEICGCGATLTSWQREAGSCGVCQRKRLEALLTLTVNDPSDFFFHITARD